MAVLNREALETSPLADLHAIASELGLDGFRRLRKADLVERILSDGDSEVAAEAEAEVEADAGGEDAAAEVDETATEAAAEEAEARPRRRRGTRGGRGRAARDADTETEAKATPEAEADAEPAPEPRKPKAGDDGDTAVEGVVELLSNGSGFVRTSPPEPSDADVYISAAQVRRCELVSGDRVSGPVRKPRRSERYPSLVRVDTINGAPVDEVAEGTPYDELACVFPKQRFELGDEDPTLKAIEWLTPLGRGSRAVICGPAHAGKSETLRRLAVALAGVEGLEVSLVLAGVRPEELADWAAGPIAAQTAGALGSASDANGQTLDRATETAKRLAARGGHAVLLVDTLDAVSPAAARRALSAARAIVDGGSVTVIATATAPFGGETTVIALDAARTKARSFPALELADSGTLRPELLVGEAGAEAIAAAFAAVDQG